MLRVGILAVLRSKKLDGKTIGVMITASHNPEPVSLFLACFTALSYSEHSKDNGVKLVDPRGEMLEAAWENHATTLANAQTVDQLLSEVDKLITSTKIDLAKPARVVYAYDTRPTGPELVQALRTGLDASGAEARNEGLQTTPILHYLVRCINSKGTEDEYGVDSEDGYMTKLSKAFKKLVVSLIFIDWMQVHAILIVVITGGKED